MNLPRHFQLWHRMGFPISVWGSSWKASRVWSRFPWLFSGLCDISPTSSVSWGIFLQNIMAIFMGHTSNTISWGYGCAMVACIDIYTSTYNWNCTLHFLQTLGLDADGPKPLDPQVKRPYWLHPLLLLLDISTKIFSQVLQHIGHIIHSILSPHKRIFMDLSPPYPRVPAEHLVLLHDKVHQLSHALRSFHGNPDSSGIQWDCLIFLNTAYIKTYIYLYMYVCSG